MKISQYWVDIIILTKFLKIDNISQFSAALTALHLPFWLIYCCELRALHTKRTWPTYLTYLSDLLPFSTIQILNRAVLQFLRCLNVWLLLRMVIVLHSKSFFFFTFWTLGCYWGWLFLYILKLFFFCHFLSAGSLFRERRRRHLQSWLPCICWSRSC